MCPYAERHLDTDKLSVSSYSVGHGTKDTQLYYQGLPIGHTSKFFSKNIVHVNEDVFDVRMPDRDVLISHDDALGKINDEITRLWQEKLDDIHSKIGDEAFASSMPATARRWHYKQIFNDMDYLPNDIVFVVEQLPMAGKVISKNVRV